MKNKASYTYDYRGLLVRKVTEDYVEYREYTIDEKLLFSEKGDETTDYIYKSNTVFAEVRNRGLDEDVYYHHTDNLGTTEAITDNNGNVVWEAEYEAFGSVLNQNGTKIFTASFTGKMYDAEAGMYYSNARWYDSEIGRFITEDPARDGIDWYAYCNNNPLRFIDPSGLKPKENKPTGTVMFSTGGRNPYNYPRTFEEWSNNVRDFWIGMAKNTDLIPEGHTQVIIIRPNEDYGNDFDSMRVAIKNTKENGIEVLTQMIGANADESMSNKYKGMTRPDGDYYYTTKAPEDSPWNDLKKQSDGSYNSNSYKNVLREVTKDQNIPTDTREKVNNDYYYSHSTVKNGVQYSGGPWGAGCAIIDGQEKQNEYMNFIAPHVDSNGIVDNVSLKYISGVY